MTMTDIRPEVHAGADFLDMNHPGWEQHIDLERLDLIDITRCVIGQLWAAEIGINEATYRPYDTALGFNEPDGRDQYDQLTSEWTALIEARRGN